MIRFGRRSCAGALALAAVSLGALVQAPGAAADTPACQEVAVPMPDGVRLDGWFRPAASGGKAPVLWTMTPYVNNACPTSIAGVDAEVAAQFNVVRISYRGTGASEGVTDAWGPQTGSDVHAVGQWIVSQQWADGLVPTGPSAEGAWIPWALPLPEVKAALMIESCADPLRGCIRTGGTLAGGVVALFAGMQEGYATGLQQRVQNGYVNGGTPAEQERAYAPPQVFLDDYETDFWKARLCLDCLSQVHAPVMYTTDLYDFVPEGAYVAYENTPAQYRWLQLAWGHASPDAAKTAGTQLYGLVDRPVRRFLEHYGLGIDNGAENDARVTVMSNTGTVSGYRQGNVLVRSESTWPLPDTNWTKLYLASGPSGSATSLADGALKTAQPSSTGADVAPIASLGPAGEQRTVLVAGGSQSAVQQLYDDQRPQEAVGLTYTTPPLAEATEITGPLELKVFASSTAPDFDWQVRLTDVHPDGRSSWIQDGQLRASLRAVDPDRSGRDPDGDIVRPWYTFAAHEPVPIGQVVEYEIQLAPTSNIFAAGDRIRLDIQPVANGYLDSARTGGAGALRILRGGAYDSSIILPLIPHRCQLDRPGAGGVTVPSDCAGSIEFAGS